MGHRPLAIGLILLAEGCVRGDAPTDRERTYGSGGGGGNATGSSVDAAQTSTTTIPPLLCDCPIRQGRCTDADGRLVCGDGDNPLCPGCPYWCVCPSDRACVFGFCERGACGDVVASPDEGCDTCLREACCQELEVCSRDPEACLDAEGDVHTDTQAGWALATCRDDRCAAECRPGICDSGVASADEQLTECASEHCCDEVAACGGEPEGWDACIECLNADGGGPRCDAALACFQECVAG